MASMARKLTTDEALAQQGERAGRGFDDLSIPFGLTPDQALAYVGAFARGRKQRQRDAMEANLARYRGVEL